MYTPNIGEPPYIRLILESIKSKLYTMIAGDCNTTLTSTDRTSTQKTDKQTEALNDTFDQMA